MSGRGRNFQSDLLERARQRGLVVHDQMAKRAPPQPLAEPPAPAVMNGKERLFALGRKASGEMNQTEAKFDAHLATLKLAGEVLWYEFEAIKLKLAPKTFLSVDFAVLPADTMRLTMIDVKGAKAIVQEDAAVKMRVAASMFPFTFQYAFPIKGGGWQIEEI
ncbi:MAG: DUF1064 domain-containing protein [Pseudomonadota bacterium]|nr:DUF1064 domain-containing protein [Pseudomonadota bacterium]